MRPTTRSPCAPILPKVYAMYSSNARQYVDNTTSAPLFSRTSRRRSTLSCSRLIWGAVAVRFSTPSMSRNRRGTSRASFPEELDKAAMGTRRRRKATPPRPGVLARAFVGAGHEGTAANEPRVTAATHIAPRGVRASGGAEYSFDVCTRMKYFFEPGLRRQQRIRLCISLDYGTKRGGSFPSRASQSGPRCARAPDRCSGAFTHTARPVPARVAFRYTHPGDWRISPRVLADRRFSETPSSWPTRTTRRGSGA